MTDIDPILNQGIEFGKQEKYSEVEQAIRRITELEPNDAGAWYNLGSTLIK